MKAFYSLTIICILSFCATFIGFSQKYEISISMKTSNDTVILGHIFAKDGPMYLDTTITLKNGKGVFKGNKLLPKGLYSIYNNRKKLDFLIGDNQKFGIVADTADFLNRTRFTSSPDNDAFYAFMRQDIPRAQKSQQLSEQYKNAATDAEKNGIREQLQALGKERNELIQKLIGENKDQYVAKFLKAFVPLELPQPPRDAQGRITDSTYVYRWYRAHFFDNFNIYDPDLLRTPFYENKLADYLVWFSRSHPVDTTCAETDRMLAKAMANSEIFRCMLVSMVNHFTQSDLMIRENIWVNLVDKWYVPHADWPNVNVDVMKKEADKRRPTLIGKVAPPLEQLLVLPPGHFKAAALDTAIKNDIHAGMIMPDFRKNINSKYLAIIFWDYHCSHCKKTIQELWNVYEACKDKGLQVIALQTVQTREAKAQWIDFINEHGMYGWVNAWIIYSAKWHDLYDVSMTPIIFLLNEKKEIVFKHVLPDQIKSYVLN